MLPADMLGVLGLPQDTIDEVRSMLAEYAESLETGNVPPMSGGIFGGSEAGQLLDHHAAIARRHVAEAILEMAGGLRGYRDGLADHVARMEGTDDRSAADMRRIQAATTCLANPDFKHPQPCTPPTGGQGR